MKFAVPAHPQLNRPVIATGQKCIGVGRPGQTPGLSVRLCNIEPIQHRAMFDIERGDRAIATADQGRACLRRKVEPVDRMVANVALRFSQWPLTEVVGILDAAEQGDASANQQCRQSQARAEPDDSDDEIGQSV